MTAQCFAPIRGTAMRLTRLDACGVPVVGACSKLITDGFITAKFTPQYDSGNEVTLRNAGGKLCVYDKPCDILKYYDAELTLCGVNPDALSMLAGYDTLLDNDGASVGIDYGEDIECKLGVGIEIWTDIANQDCSTGTVDYGYLLVPWAAGFRVTGDVTIQNDVVNAVITGNTKKGGGWGSGPYNVVMNDAVLPATTPAPGKLLTPIGPKTHMRLLSTTVAPPTIPADCGCTALAA